MAFLDLRTMRPEDIPGVVELSKVAFTQAFGMSHWTPPELEAHLEIFPQGQHVLVMEDELAAAASSLIVNEKQLRQPHTWKSITGGGRFTNHDAKGDWLYGTSVAVHPEMRKVGLLGLLYRARKVTARWLDLQGVAIGGRMPGYSNHKDRMPAEEYILKVRAGELSDPVLTPQMSFGFEPVRAMREYLTDEASGNYACLMLWHATRKHGPEPLVDEDMEESEEDLTANLDWPAH